MFHAFKHANHVTNDFKNIFMEIIKVFEGLPLNLEILACYLCDIRDLEIWKNALCELKARQNIIGGLNNGMFWKTSQISYDHSVKIEQDMFLDIDCFFTGLKKKHFVECIGMLMVYRALCVDYKT